MRSLALRPFLTASLSIALLASCLLPDFEVVPVSGTVPEAGTPTIEAGNPDARACDATKPCATGTCVDGFCCDSACAGKCEACNVPGQEGRCTAVKGAPTHGACVGAADGPCAGSCDGTNRNTCTFPTTACGTGSCAAGVATPVPRCQQGACLTEKAQRCSLGCFEDGCLGVKQVTAGYYFTCVVLTDKKMRCWGSNDNGQTGQFVASPPADITTPMEVPNLTNVVSAAATFGSACALLGDGTVKCWGSNNAGQLGRGAGVDSLPHPQPQLVAGVTGATFLGGSSGGHFCAVVAGGNIKCWGSNFTGQFGAGNTGGDGSTPKLVCEPGATALPCKPAVGATFVAGGDDHTCAIFGGGGNVACWGGNAAGQCAQPLTNTQLFPKLVAGLNATYLTAGNRLTCAASAGTAKCWGGNGAGRLGNGTDSGGEITPVAVCTKQDCSTKIMGVTGVTTYDESSCALTNGAVKCWGINTGGQLGDGNATASQNYAASTAVAAGAVQVASGGQVNLAVVANGPDRTLLCWGNEGSSQCGDGTGSKPRPTPISPKW